MKLFPGHQQICPILYLNLQSYGLILLLLLTQIKTLQCFC
uniref:Uncharacterized protein n=1 Tax=Anguilla anguilla TaxID=7936 RepID=A0A0E9UJT9_ANGAN